MSATPATQDLDLHEGFRAFVDASRRLEQSYAALKQRAEAIDLELAATVRRLEQTLHEKETILRSLPVGVLAVGSAREVLWANPEGQRLRAEMEAQGEDIAELPDGECERGGVTVGVLRASLPDGTTLLVVENRTPVAMLSREVDRLDRLAGLSELALGIAHEIKNPLNGVMGFASLMERSEDDDELRRYAQKVRLGLTQVDDIVREMLAFADSPDRAENRMPLRTVVERAASAAGVPSRCISLGAGADIEVDSSALVRVLANLFRNSAEAAGAEVAIAVEADAAAHPIELTVADDGPGIEAALGSRVFEPFVSSKDRGHGLGLALASRVMTFLGGSLELTNPGEAGAAFRLTLPDPSVREASHG